MPMHTVIRQRRIALGLTQEQAAARLGVTAPAVNKWEKGVTCPDIGLLAPLARLLGTDVNTLLCFQEDLTDQEIIRFTGEVAEVLRQEGCAGAFAKARALLREYPACDRLLYNLTLVLEGGLLGAGLSGEERALDEQALQGFYERLLESEDGPLRESAAYMLAGRKLREGDFDQAQALLDRLPKTPGIDRRQLQAQLFLRRGEAAEAVKLLEQTCLCHANQL